MKIGQGTEKRVKSTRPDKNNSKKNLLLFLVMAVTVVLIFWVYTMGKKAEQTVSVIMMAKPVYKNQAITEDCIKEYKMLTGEFEKYATSNDNGIKKRRILLWEERNLILNAFAAYPLQSDTVAMYNNFIKSRTDNSDTVLYSFPGKEIVTMKIADSDLQSYKTFLQPGDRINITAIFSSQEKQVLVDENGEQYQEDVDTFRQETVFNDIMIADLLNSSGESILDIYASYNEMTVYQQAKLDSNDAWLESVQPSVVLIALTPEEVTRYYEYKSKSDVEFLMSLPQRQD